MQGDGGDILIWWRKEVQQRSQDIKIDGLRAKNKYYCKQRQVVVFGIESLSY
jgi:hypothetical protein